MDTNHEEGEAYRMTRYELLTPQTHFDAVILANGTFPTHALPLGLLHQAKHVFCCDGAITELSRHTDIVPDAIVGDCDSLSLEMQQSYASIIHHVSEQDYNDLTKATRYTLFALGNKSNRTFCYLGATGKREDHTLGNISLLAYYYQELGVQPFMVSDYGYFIVAHGDCLFSCQKGQEFSVFNISCSHLSSEGLRWQLYPFTSLWQGTLNQTLGSEVNISGDGLYAVYLPFA